MRRGARAFRGLLDKAREICITVREPVRVMCGQGDVHPIPHVEPLRMVIHLLGLDRHARHEAERGVEVDKGEGLLDGVALAL